MAHELVGVWSLVSWEWVDAKGDSFKPFGNSPDGFIVFTADGFSSATFAHEARPRFQSDVVFAASDAEWAAAARSYIALMGPYRIDGDVLTYDVAVSLFPNWAGVPQERRYQIEGDRLTLRTLTPVPVAGVERTGIATLQRFRH